MIKKKNYTIDVLRLFFSIFIVALHVEPFTDISRYGSYFVDNVFSRLGVPFFATVSGYYLYNYSTDKCIKYLKKLVPVYLFWTSIMLVYDFTIREWSLSGFFTHCFQTVCLKGWGQLWYLLAIIYTVLIIIIKNEVFPSLSMSFFCYTSVFLLIVGIVKSAYGGVFLSLRWVRSIFGNGETDSFLWNWLLLVVPFFFLGAFLHMDIPKCIKRWSGILFLCSGIGLVLEVIIITITNIKGSATLCLFTYPIIFFLMIWALNDPLNSWCNFSSYCRVTASVVYYIHVLLMFIIPPFSRTILRIEISRTMLFCVIVSSLLCAGYIVWKSNIRAFKRIL